MNSERLEKFSVRDLRKKDKFFIDDLYLNGYAKKCGVYATGVYVSLFRHADKEQKSWPSLKRIAEELAVSKSQILRAIKKLEEFNIIKRERLGKKLNNRYYLIDKSEWSGRNFTGVPQKLQVVSGRNFHIKDTQFKDTQERTYSYKKKPFFRGMEMRFVKDRWKCIPKDGGRWLEFVGKESEIEYK